MEPGTIQKTILIFQDAFDKLEVDVSVDEVENLAIVVDRAMNLSARSFHTPQHVFKLSDMPSPLQSLAALFHDVVYYQVDQGFSREIGSIVSPYIHVTDNGVLITTKAKRSDRLFDLNLDVFGFRRGQQLTPSNGLNEFLSALVAIKNLDPMLSLKDLLKIAVCIEATIPFRGPDERGQTYGEITEERVVRLNQTYGFGMTPDEIEDTVKLGVYFSNKDVESFAELDVSRFLDDTWKLLPETNISLRDTSLYSIKEYRKALLSTENFLCALQADVIFKRYNGIPEEQTYLELVKRANENLCIGREYLGIKLLTQAILESLAEVTGGDAPLALFMGDVRYGTESPRRLEDFLPSLPEPVHANPLIYRLLANGREHETNFDMRSSPLSLFIYQSLGEEKIQILLESAKQFFAENLSPKAFLAKIDRAVLVPVIRATAFLATTRREALLELLVD